MHRMGVIQKRIASRWNVPASSDAYSNRETISYFLILVQTNKKAYAHSGTDVWKKSNLEFLYIFCFWYILYTLKKWFFLFLFFYRTKWSTTFSSAHIKAEMKIYYIIETSKFLIFHISAHFSTLALYPFWVRLRPDLIISIRIISCTGSIVFFLTC